MPSPTQPMSAFTNDACAPCASSAPATTQAGLIRRNALADAADIGVHQRRRRYVCFLRSGNVYFTWKLASSVISFFATVSVTLTFTL
jgi:hypothetical protein